MTTRYCLYFLALLMIYGNADAQKVKRKGMDPIDVSKQKRIKTPAGPVFTTSQFLGKWQEVSRKDRAGNGVPVKDTLYLNFIAPNRVITRDGNAATNLTGEASIEPGNVLLAAADVYTVLSVNDSTAVLDNQEEYLHTFRKTNEFFFETYGRQSVRQDEFSVPVLVTTADIAGNWRVYRKVAKPGAINPPVNIIQYLKIADTTGTPIKGEITFYQTNQTLALPCEISIRGTALYIASGDYSWEMNVYKAKENELVFGDPSTLLYYAKGF